MAEDDKKTDEETKIEDMEALSDEDFMKLAEPTEGSENKEEKDDGLEKDGELTDGKPTDTDGGVDASGASEDADGPKDGSESGGEKDEAGGSKDDDGGSDDGNEDPKKGVNDDKDTLTLKDKDGKEIEPTKEEKTAKSETEAQELAKAQEDATSFFDKVSAPFKADGKEVQVRTPEEAIRLMQMGVNYSRRMQEMKPLREMNAMLEAHGLNDPQKLNELIDLSKGGKEAIQKYLKKHNIDPLDLDASKGDEHTTPNYQSDPKDVAFQDAIDTTLMAPGGKELLGDVNKDWDGESKEALRENPSIFGKLLEQKEAGVYELINKELLHQRTMGYLAGVPFLQAYEEVGNAMQKAGVFDTKDTQKKGLAPIDSGSRKAAPKPKTEQPNPNLSSASKSRNVASNDAATTEPDYLSMDDDAFMKLAQPV